MNATTNNTTTMSTGTAKMKARDLAYIAVFAVLMAICSWISIPLTIPVTLQTFGVFLACIVLGGKRGTLSIIVFILLGAIGIPVFSGFTGGIGVLLGNTGGYIIGFICSALIMWLFEKLFKGALWATIASMILGLIACYAVGTIWFMIVYAKAAGAVALASVLGWCVIPFIIPDAVKIALALIIGNRLNKALAKAGLL